MENALSQSLPALGFSGVFLFLLQQIWNHHKKMLDRKDEQIQAQMERMDVSFEKNIEVMQKNTMLTEEIYKALKGDHKL